VTSTNGTPATPPGWYSDPNTVGLQRWWDGTQWTEHTNTPAIAIAGPPPVNPDLPVYNPWIWLILVTQFLPLLLLPVWLPGYLTATFSAVGTEPNSMTGAYSAMFTPGYFAAVAVGLLSAAAGIVLAYVDYKTLLRVGVARPFHWAWAFLDSYGVYIIGRSVVAKRRAGRGLAPMVLWICITVAVFVASIVFAVILVVAVTQAISDIVPNLH
jgi:Protein of unknown function (DUF2510)